MSIVIIQNKLLQTNMVEKYISINGQNLQPTMHAFTIYMIYLLNDVKCYIIFKIIS